MKHPTSRILLIVLVVVVSGCSKGSTRVNDDGVVNVLFIGNSLTFWNDMPDIFECVAGSAGKDIYVDQATEGGASLVLHSHEPETTDKIALGGWDYVILQDSSYYVAFPEYHYLIYPGFIAMKELIHSADPDTRIIMFMDWSLEEGISTQTESYSYVEFQDMLIEGCIAVADSLGFLVAPIGAAWKTVTADRPQIDLYDTDTVHPSLSGSYLQACVYYAAIFRQGMDQPYCRDTLPGDDATYLEQVATTTVLDNLALWNLTDPARY